MERWDIYDKDRNLTGRTCERGFPLPEGDYSLIVHIWIQNDAGEYLISKRTPNKSFFPNLWECTGGAAIAGDDSLSAALRETREELGIELDPLSGRMIRTLTDPDCFVDIWLFHQEVDLNDIVFQDTETCDAMWATPGDIRRMKSDGSFVPVFKFLEWLFAYDGPIPFFPPAWPHEVKYAVTVARYQGQWVYVRHQDRTTLELPGGHIEPGESPACAAKRELREESGAEVFELWPVCIYSVARGTNAKSAGQLCFAEVEHFGEIPAAFEMAERVIVDDVPDNLTYPEIVPKLVERVERWLAER